MYFWLFVLILLQAPLFAGAQAQPEPEPTPQGAAGAGPAVVGQPAMPAPATGPASDGGAGPTPEVAPATAMAPAAAMAPPAVPPVAAPLPVQAQVPAPMAPEGGAVETPPPAALESQVPAPSAPPVAAANGEVVLDVEQLGDSAGIAGHEVVAPDEAGVIEVTVAGTKLAKTAGSAHILKPQQLERFEYDDPHAALLQVPGVYVRQEDGAGLRPNISLRGVNSDRSKKITLMEDGVLFGPAPYSAPAAYYFPMMTRMSNLRVIKGPSAVAYGPQTVGGALDMVTRSIPSAPTGFLDLGIGQFGYGKVHGYFGGSDGQTGFLIEGVHLQSNGFKELPDGADTGFDRNEWMMKGSYLLDPTAETTHEFQIKLGYSDEISNETYLGLTDADFAINPDQRYAASALDQMKYHRTALQLAHQFEAPAAELKVTTTVYRHDFERAWNKFNGFRGVPVAAVLAEPLSDSYVHYHDVLRGAADSDLPMGEDMLLIGPNQRTYISQGIQSVLGLGFRTGSLGHRLEAGLRLHYDSIVRNHSQSAYVMRDGSLSPAPVYLMSQSSPVAGGRLTEVNTDNEASTWALAAHVMDAITLADLTLTPGVRLEVIRSRAKDSAAGTDSGDTQVVPLPGVGAFYNLTKDFGLLAGVYRGFSPAVLDDEGTSSVEPELSVNYEAGARYSTRRSRAELIGFFNDYSNLTNVCTFSSGCTTTNIDQQFDGNAVHVYGVEVYGEHTWKLGQFSLPMTAAYTLTRSSFRSDFESADPTFGEVQKGDELPYVPRHQFNVTLAVQHKVAQLVAGLTYTSVAREQAGGGSLADAQTTDSLLWMDVGANIHMMDNLELYANVRNLFDQRAIVSRRPFGARPNAPRTVQVGVKGTL